MSDNKRIDQSPFISPQIVKEYNEVTPGLGTALLEEFRREISLQRERQIKREERAHEQFMAELSLRRRGQWFASTLIIFLFLVVTFAIFRDANWVASILGSGTIISILTVYLRSESLILSKNEKGDETLLASAKTDLSSQRNVNEDYNYHSGR